MTTLSLAIVAIVVLACPLTMLWRIWRGRGARCCTPEALGAAQVHRDQARLAARIEQLGARSAARAPD